MKRSTRFWGVSYIALGVTGFVMAQAQGQGVPNDPLQPFEACAVIEDALERVACFDTALLEARDIVTRSADMKPVMERSEEKAASPQLAAKPRENTDNRVETLNDFGKSAVLRNKERREQGLKPEAPQELTAKILSHRYDVYGKLTITLDNGQVWQSTGKSGIKKISGNDNIAKIRQSSFGGYRLQIEGKRARAVVRRIK